MQFIRFLQVLSVPLLVLSLSVGCATGPASFEQNVQSAVNRGNVYIDMRDDGTVYLYGWTEDYYSRQRAESIARSGEGVTRVVNSISVPF